ncbi:MAG: hypothetical protein NTW16_00700 [Bacteroidetes bacterium]|nr:hypothetical protein [Bacteroidota bacterium]
MKTDSAKKYSSHKAAVEDNGLDFAGYYETSTGTKREVYCDQEGKLWVFYGHDHGAGKIYSITMREFNGSADELTQG